MIYLKRMVESNDCCNISNHIFISYSQADKEIVFRISNNLEKLNYKISIKKKITEGNNSELTTDIQNRINNSHLFICFVSRKYCKIKNFEELIYAQDQNKNILPIILDDCFKNEESVVNKLIKLQMHTFYSYKTPNCFIPWSNNHFEKLKNIIYKLISETCSNEFVRILFIFIVTKDFFILIFL